MPVVQEVSLDTKCKLVQICAEYLGDVWCCLKPEEVDCKLMSAGLSNFTYFCSIAGIKNGKQEIAVPKDAVVHLYGNGIFGEKNPLKLNGVAAESVIIQKLADLGLYPKLYGVFESGRVEEHIPSKTATPEDLQSIEISKVVMRKLARIHSLDLPISKSPDFVEKVGGLLQGGEEPNFGKIMEKYDEKDQLRLQNVLNFPLINEFASVASIIPKINHRVICSHNDMNNNNILLKNEYSCDDDRVLILDYELCRYFYRGFDIAYFFRMKKSRLHKDEGGKVHLNEEEIDESHNDQLLEEYLKYFAKYSNERDPKYDTVDHLKMEVTLFDLFYDCLFIGYALFVIQHSPVALDYIEGLALNFKAKKEAVMMKYGDIFESGD